MLTTSKYIMHGSSTRCTFCNKPFCFRDGYVELWRTANGEHFCSEFCADDAEEAQFRVQHTASSSGATATHSAQPTASMEQKVLRLAKETVASLMAVAVTVI